MSNDQPTSSPEALVPFSERVTIDTLADRPSIPSFDVRPEEWKPETGLRLEGTLVSGRIGNNYEGAQFVVVFGPPDEFGRPAASYEKSLGMKVHAGIYGDKSRFVVGGAYKENGQRVDSIIREGDLVSIAEKDTDIRYRDAETVKNKPPVDNSVLKVESIKSGPLA